MSLDELAAKINAGTASPEEQDAFVKTFPHLPELAALASKPPPTAEQTKHAQARAAREYRKYQRREARRPTIHSYARKLRLKTQVLQLQAHRDARVADSPRRAPAACRQPRSRRVRTASRARSPGQKLAAADGGDPPPEPSLRTLLEHAAAWH